MFMGAGLLRALKAISSGCHGPVSSKPGFLSGCASFGIGTSSFKRQRTSLSLPRKLSINPWMIWRNVHGLPLMGSSYFSSHRGHEYFWRTGAGEARISRRALNAAAAYRLTTLAEGGGV